MDLRCIPIFEIYLGFTARTFVIFHLIQKYGVATLIAFHVYRFIPQHEMAVWVITNIKQTSLLIHTFD